jgi:alpha-beta hydrolase superfamily lysophospholipase
MRPAHLLAAAVAAAFATQTSAQAPKVVMEEMTVPSEPGIEIYVRNKRPTDLSAFRPERTVLFVHGATYPAHTSFDLKLDGMSWMDYIAARGYDVYLLDLMAAPPVRKRWTRRPRPTRRSCAARRRSRTSPP